MVEHFRFMIGGAVDVAGAGAAAADDEVDDSIVCPFALLSLFCASLSRQT